MSTTQPWSFRALEQEQGRDIRKLSLWERLLLHDTLLAHADMIAGARLGEQASDQRHLHQALSKQENREKDADTTL